MCLILDSSVNSIVYPKKKKYKLRGKLGKTFKSTTSQTLLNVNGGGRILPPLTKADICPRIRTRQSRFSPLQRILTSFLGKTLKKKDVYDKFY